MSKIYDLYSPDQRKIDNLKRRIRGYQKMEKDLQRDIRKTNNKNRELQQRIDKAIEYIDKLCLCSSGYFDYGDDLSPKHIVDILKGDNDE